MGLEFPSDKTIQTPEVKKELEKYPCFYCDKDITSELQALEHRVTCHGATDTQACFPSQSGWGPCSQLNP